MPKRYTITNVKYSNIQTGTPPGNIKFGHKTDKGTEPFFRGTISDSIANPLKYKQGDTELEFEEIGQDTSRKINDLEKRRDDIGFTNPNLHRRIDVKMPENSEELVPREYRLQINQYNSYRTTHVITHIDYTDLDKYQDSEHFDEIQERFQECEKKEIP